MNLDELHAAAQKELSTLATMEQLETFRIKYLGSKGLLKAASDHLKTIPNDQKRNYGSKLNTVKQAVQMGYDAAKTRMAGSPESGEILEDITEPGRMAFADYHPGSLHIIHQTIDALTDLFGRMGFSVAEGPELEDEFHNFEALNVPRQHPARDPLDNFYLQRPPGGTPFMLRSQTSSVQIRVLETQKPPVRIVAPGRVYRPDTVDATHSFMFHQIEGLVVDEHITMIDLKTCIEQFARAFFGADVETRFRPSYFPFTEPSAEFDVRFHYAHGGSKWVELGGCGMVDPNVLEMVKVDPEKYSGFAFGLGVERIAMRKHGIEDIRLLFENDVRFLRQF
ncbi:MAG: phenylalanine--tRNA ligase subunit alpha [Phycisphaerae bacterium]